MEAKQTRLAWVKDHGANLAAYGGVIFCVLLFTILTPIFGESIWAQRKLETLMSNVIVTALMSVGAVFVYSLGNMDISIGKQVGLYATILVVMGNSIGSLVLPIVVCLVLSVIFAAINGATGELLHIHPIIPSLVVMFVLSGVNSMIFVNLDTRNISLTSMGHEIFKSPILMLVVLVAEVLAVSYLFNFTKYGKYARAIGANQTAAQQSGVNLVKYKVIAYVIMGVCVVVASVFQMGYTGAAADATGTGFEMNVMVALILGGMPLSGGMRSRVSCAVVGAFTFALLDVGLPMIGIAARNTFIIKAIIFLVVVLITCRKKGGVLPR